MKKSEIEQRLLDASETELTEISDFFSTKLGKVKVEPDPAKAIATALDQAAQGWEEKDGRFVCKNTCNKGRLCMREDLVKDPVVVKKPDLSVETLLTPNALRDSAEEKEEKEAWDAVGKETSREKKASDNPAVENLLTPDWIVEQEKKKE